MSSIGSTPKNSTTKYIDARQIYRWSNEFFQNQVARPNSWKKSVNYWFIKKGEHSINYHYHLTKQMKCTQDFTSFYCIFSQVFPLMVHCKCIKSDPLRFSGKWVIFSFSCFLKRVKSFLFYVYLWRTPENINYP